MQPLIQQSLSPVTPAPLLGGQDVSFALDQLTALNKADPNGLLTGRLGLQHVGTFGVSLGAMVASEACHRFGPLIEGGWICMFLLRHH